MRARAVPGWNDRHVHASEVVAVGECTGPGWLGTFSPGLVRNRQTRLDAALVSPQLDAESGLDLGGATGTERLLALVLSGGVAGCFSFGPPSTNCKHVG